MNRWFEVYTTRFGRPDSRQVAIVFKDITQRKLAEQALRESEDRFRNMADNAPVMIWVTEPDGSCIYLSQSWYAFTGQTPETGLNLGWLNAIHPDDRIQIKQSFQVANERHQPLRLEYRLRRHDGEFRWTIDSAQPRFSENGLFLGYIGSVIDITERKQAEAELERLYVAEQVARAEAEAAVQVRDQFLSIASHELRNPLTALLGYADLLSRNAEWQGTDPRTKIAVDRVVQQAQRLNEMIEHLLDVSRLQRGQFDVNLQPFDLNAHVEHVVDRFRMTLTPAEEQHRIVLLPASEELHILGDVPRLEEVIVNLLSNATKYSKVGQSVTVRVAQEGAEVILEVVDQGVGIPPEALAHLFVPFYRAHNVSAQTSGFGIGLYVVREIVQRHSGRVEVESTQGFGSTFRVVLPLHVLAP
jgi:PAS domain S-box-containing protein